MPTRTRLKRKTRRKEGMPSKELLLARLLVSGLGLDPKWLLNRFLTNCFYWQKLYCVHAQQAEAERAAVVETGKAKETVARARTLPRCLKGLLLRGLKVTGDVLRCVSISDNLRHLSKDSLHHSCPMDAMEYAADPNVMFFPQRLGSCLASPFLLWWPTQASPFTSTTMMVDLLPLFSWRCFLIFDQKSDITFVKYLV